MRNPKKYLYIRVNERDFKFNENLGTDDKS